MDELRNSGFLWVCWEGSTFFRPEVTDPPRLSSAKRAPGPPPPGAFGVDCDAAGGGGGGAGAEDEEEGTEEGAGSPWTISLDTFSAEWHAADLGVPSDSGSVPLLDVFLQGVKQLRECFRPSDSCWVAGRQPFQTCLTTYSRGLTSL
jgi:hypothetical protein